jgi:hypothetical protein
MDAAAGDRACRQPGLARGPSTFSDEYLTTMMPLMGILTHDHRRRNR